MSLLRRRSNSSAYNSAEDSDEEEGKSLLRGDDSVNGSKYKIPVLRQQLLMRTTQRGGGCAKICLVVSILGVVVLTTIAISLGKDALYCSLMLGEEEDRKKMVDGLAGAVVLYAITGSFSFLLLWIRQSPSSFAIQGGGRARRDSLKAKEKDGIDNDSL